MPNTSSPPPGATSPPPTKPLNIAVIGSGIAGLSSAYLLSREHNVTIYEREAKLGMDAHAIQNPDGTHFDVPLRIFNPEYYPNLTKLYDTVGVSYEPVSSAFSCTYLLPGEARSTTGTRSTTSLAYFRYSNSKTIIKTPYPALSLNPLHTWIPGFVAAVSKYSLLFYELVYFFVQAPRDLHNGKLADLTLGSYLRQNNYSDALINELLYPMLTVVCTCSYSSVASYPAEVIIAYYNSYGAWSWFPNLSRTKKSVYSGGDHCRVSEGVCDVVEKLARNCDKLMLGTGISCISPATKERGPAVSYVDNASKRTITTVYDKIVVATQAHHARKLLDPETTNPRLIKALGCWNHESSRVVVHTDPRLMPSRKEDWSPVNLIMEPNSTQSQLELEARVGAGGSNNLSDSIMVDQPATAATKLSASMCSIWMCAVDDKLDKDLIQTWNPVIEPAKDTVVANSWFVRPILNSSSSRGIEELKRLQGEGGLYFVGAYSLYSMPLLENGVRSSCLVAKELGSEAPWGDLQYQGDKEIEERRKGEGTRGGGGAVLGGGLRVGVVVGGLLVAGLGLLYFGGDAKERRAGMQLFWLRK